MIIKSTNISNKIDAGYNQESKCVEPQIYQIIFTEYFIVWYIMHLGLVHRIIFRQVIFMGKYGLYITRSKTTLMIRVPGCEQENINFANAEQAKKRRDDLCLEKGISSVKRIGTRKHTTGHSDKAHPLPVRVCLIKKMSSSRKNIKLDYICAQGNELKGAKKRSWSIEKLGLEEASRQASEWQSIVDRSNTMAWLDESEIGPKLRPGIKLVTRAAIADGVEKNVQFFEVRAFPSIAIHRKAWSISRYGHELALHSAEDWLSRMERIIEIDMMENATDNPEIVDELRDILPKNVSIRGQNKVLVKDGAGFYYSIATMSRKDLGIKTKIFSCRRYGLAGAIRRAVECNRKLKASNKKMV